MTPCTVPRRIAAALLLAASSLFASYTHAAQPVTPMTPDIAPAYDPIRPQADFIKRVTMIPMRDGVKLYTVIFIKKGVKDQPILLSRTPYDAKGTTERTASQVLTEVLPAMDAVFVDDGYIRVYQDIRGMHGSEGEFVMNRPLAGPLNPTGIDESSDAYDSIDWLVKHVPESNGKVGIIGSSYLGFTTLMAEINPHPALKAAAPQSPMVDGWIGDDWFHNGAFRNPSIDYAVEMSADKGKGAPPPVGVGDQYTRYLQAGSSGDYIRQWGLDRFPFLQKLMQNPSYTAFWSQQAVDTLMAARPLTVPTMLIVGQWDQEDSYGTPAVYRALEPKDINNDRVSLVIGPWRHSGVNHYGYDLGALTFTGDTAEAFRRDYLKPFFDHYLKGAPDPHTPPVLTYATGSNRWERSPRWPMGTPTPLYLTADFGASFTAPDSAGHDDYVSDPAKPVPFIPRPIDTSDGSQWKPWLVHDQRFVSDRPDVLVYQSAPLEAPVHIMGAPGVELFAATSGGDSDWVVKLIDVYPDSSPEPAVQGSKPGMAGFELPVGIEIFRGRYVHGFDNPQPLTPGKIEEYRFELPHVDHVFLPGHRIGVQVQSSLFPLYDRNPQTWVDNIFNAQRGDYRPAKQSIQRGPGQASRVMLPVVK
ncbi:MAG: glutaryl-7-ACA acylase [Lysobacterales bacterium CG17_big_fil_post_rev_8_21_14_2_50_64_11]|nr:MAG: glutaryl-7-ACA acylase [Xanthomonadales bacterium CG17_big_fil_post_rev_8_21_14_2_50_64_11]PIX60592.1 MAG: glutaryl-7-ACA acylase [Xanthomonadales bacterium CG_4_10_14_3_um_filter_64_11]